MKRNPLKTVILVHLNLTRNVDKTVNENADETVNGDATLESDCNVRGPCLL